MCFIWYRGWEGDSEYCYRWGITLIQKYRTHFYHWQFRHHQSCHQGPAPSFVATDFPARTFRSSWSVWHQRGTKLAQVRIMFRLWPIWHRMMTLWQVSRQLSMYKKVYKPDWCNFETAQYWRHGSMHAGARAKGPAQCWLADERQKASLLVGSSLADLRWWQGLVDGTSWVFAIGDNFLLFLKDNL